MDQAPGDTDHTGAQELTGSPDNAADLLKADLMTPTHQTALIRTFAALRFTTGAAAWLAPNKTGRLMGLSAGHDQPFTTQLFGSRELTLALAITDPVSPQLRSFALRLGLLTDALDVIAAVRGIRADTLLLVAEGNTHIADLNRTAQLHIAGARLELVPHATHHYDDTSAITHVAWRTVEWFSTLCA